MPTMKERTVSPTEVTSAFDFPAVEDYQGIGK